jgi:hypothetical protein
VRDVARFAPTLPGRSRTQPHAILSAVAVARGDLGGARRHCAAAYASAQQVRHGRSVALVVEGLAGLAVADGRAARAATLLGLAESIRAGLGSERPSLASAAPAARAAALAVLGVEAFDAATARGRAIQAADIDEVIRAELAVDPDRRRDR